VDIERKRGSAEVDVVSVFCIVDDKYVPLYRILWVSALPHFCGAEDCEREGEYEVRLEDGESVWADREERDAVLTALEAWAGDEAPPENDDEYGDSN
jgi:hypothetical protein